MEQRVVDGEDQVGHHLPQQDGTLVILPLAETHGDQCAEPDELVKYVHPSFLLIKNAAHPVGCVAKNEGNAPEKSTLVLEFHCTMGQPYLSIAAKDNLQKPWAFGGECDCPQLLLSAPPHIARKGEREGGTFDGFPHSCSITRPQATGFALQNRTNTKKDTLLRVFFRVVLAHRFCCL